jgi:hypothetical protein
LTQATTLAQDRAEQFMALPYNHPDLADTISPGKSETNSQGYKIRWEVGTDAPSGIKTIDIYITWKNKTDNTKSFNLSVRKSII